MRKQGSLFRRIAPWVMSAIATFSVARSASASPVNPVEGEDYEIVAGPNKGSTYIRVTPGENINADALAKVLKTTEFDVRTDNPTRTLALCKHAGGGYSMSDGIRGEQGRATDSVWSDCAPPNEKHVYILPGEIIEITGQHHVSASEKAAAADAIAKCETLDCINTQRGILGAKPIETPKSDAKQTPTPKDDPKAETPKSPPSSEPDPEITRLKGEVETLTKGKQASDKALADWKSTATIWGIRAIYWLYVALAFAFNAVFFALAFFIARRRANRAEAELKSLRKRIEDDPTIAMPAVAEKASDLDFAVRAETAERQFRAEVESTKSARVVMQQTCDDWGIKVGANPSLELLAKKLVDRAKNPQREDPSVKAMQKDFAAAKATILAGLNLKVVIEPTTLNDLCGAMREKHAKALAEAKQPSDVMLTDAAAFGLDLTDVTSQDAYLAIREAHEEHRQRLAHYAEALKIDGLPADASAKLLAQNMFDWTSRKNESYDDLLKEHNRKKSAMVMIWDMFRRTADIIGIDHSLSEFKELPPLVNAVMKRMSRMLDERQDEVSTAEVWLEGFFAEYARVNKDLVDTRKAVIDLSPVKQREETARRVWRSFVDAKHVAVHRAAEAISNAPTAHGDELMQDAVLSLRAEALEHTQAANKLRDQLLIQIAGLLDAVPEDLAIYLSDELIDEPTHQLAPPSIDPKVTIESPPPPRTLRGVALALNATNGVAKTNLEAEGGVDDAFAKAFMDNPESRRAPRVPSFSDEVTVVLEKTMPPAGGAPTNGAAKLNGAATNGAGTNGSRRVSYAELADSCRTLRLATLDGPVQITPEIDANLRMFLNSPAVCDSAVVHGQDDQIVANFLHPEEQDDERGHKMKPWTVLSLMYGLNDLNIPSRKLTLPPEFNPNPPSGNQP